MSNETENLSNFRKLHEGIVQEIKRAPANEEQRAEPISTAENTLAAQDVANYVARVQKAGQALEQSTRRVRELETLLNDVRDRQAGLEAALDEAARTNTDLEDRLAAERNRAAWAHAVALKAMKRAQEVEKALADAHSRTEALTSAIQRAFGDVVGISGSEGLAAA